MKTHEVSLSTELNYLLNKLASHTGFSDTNDNYRFLQALFRVIREHISFEYAIKFNDMLPLSLKAVFLDEWHIKDGDKTSFRDIDHLANEVMQGSNLDMQSAAEARQLLRKVFTFLGQLASSTQMKEGLSFLPDEFRALLLQDPDLRYTYSDTCIWLS